MNSDGNNITHNIGFVNTQKTNNLIWFIMHTKRFLYSWTHNSPTLLLFSCVCKIFTSKKRCTQTTMRSVNWNRIKVYQYIWTGLGMFWTHIIRMSTTEVSIYIHFNFFFTLNDAKHIPVLSIFERLKQKHVFEIILMALITAPYNSLACACACIPLNVKSDNL